MTAIPKVLLVLLVMFPAMALAQVPRCSILDFCIFRDVETYGVREAAVTPGGVEFLAHPSATIEHVDRAAEIVAGEWTFEFQYESHVLCRKTFTVE